ncbi:MAG: Rieske (2Fe-2S) protein [Chloroflexi bacterium]|nr:Rieske (2Fe-2S) protein [Chloroflexota bacterium]
MPEISPQPHTSPFTTRRRFIQAGIGLVGAAWAGVFVQSRIFPEATAEGVKPVEVPLAELPVGGTKAITYGATPVLVLRTAEGLRAFALICTHLGCIVQWQEGKKEFFCPCHQGIFDQFGEVISGPPPVPLEQVAVKVEGEKVIVGEAA